MQEDHQLLIRLQSGDRDALFRIYQKYKDRLLTVARSLLADVSLAEDCLHDVFVRLAGDGPNLKIHDLKSYLTTCVANRARDHWRCKKRLNVPLDMLPEVGSDNDEPVVQLSNTETWRILLQAMDRLPYEQREVIILHLQGELTFKEIAGQQKVTINTVQSRYRYGLEKMQKMLQACRSFGPESKSDKSNGFE